MKEGWEIKKLGEVCTKLTDGSHNPPKGIQHSNYVMLSSQNIFNDKVIYDDVRFLQEADFLREDKRTCVQEGDILLTIVGTIGRCAVFTGSKNVTLQRSVAVLRPQENVFPRYLMYCLIGKNASLNEEAHGIAQKGIYLKQLSQVIIPIPSITEQEKIVAELDCLSGIIEKKKQQLKEYDALAQSIFYEMFGDPVENEKAWEVNVIGDIAKFYNGAAHEGEILENGKYHVVNSKFISTNGEVRKYCNSQIFPLLKNDIVMVMSDVPNGKALAKCYIIEDNDIYTLNQRICAFRNYELVPIFLYYCLNRNPYYLSFDNGNSQTNLRKKDVLNCPIIKPPLTLQQEFASKIEAIEKQKALIKKSIEEVETLFNSRMDQYFN